MPISVVDTVGGTTSNSYVSVDYATAYIDIYGMTEAIRTSWTAAGSDDKARSLIVASRDLDMYMLWNGHKSSDLQALEWPRTGTMYLSNEIPEPLKQAVTEFALWRLQNESPVTDIVAFDSISVGPIKIDYNDNMTGTTRKYVPDNVLTRLKNLGSLDVPTDASINMLKQVRLIRS